MSDHEFSSGNQQRMLSEVVTVDGWATPVEGDDRRVAFHVVLAFEAARMGGEDVSEVRFTIGIKRCEVVLIPPQEPGVNVDKKTVSRPPPLVPLARRQLEARRSKLGFAGTLKASISKALTGGGDASLSIDAAHSRERESSLAGEQSVNPYDEGWKKTPEGYDAWTLNGGLLENGVLANSIWDGTKPRLQFVDTRENCVREREKERQIEPHARIEIRCVAEDIWIDDIQFKDPERQKMFSLAKHKAEKITTARQFIMHELKSRALEPGDITRNTLAKLKIADVALKIF